MRWSAAWHEARAIVWASRGRLAAGLLLLLVSRLSALVLPGLSKFFVDEVLQHGRTDLLPPLAWTAAAAVGIQAITSFGLSQVIGVAAFRAIADMRRRVGEHIIRLPVRHFESTQTGALVSRLMTDPEGLSNLLGMGLMQLAGSLVTTAAALAVLLYLNWRLALATVFLLALFGGVMTYSFRVLRPLFRERGRLSAELTGRFTQTVGGIRVIKTYTAERHEDLVLARGVHALFRHVVRSMTAVSATGALSGIVIRALGIVMIVMGGRAIAGGTMSLGDLFMYLAFTGVMAAPIVQLASTGPQLADAFAGLDRIRDLLDTPREDAEDAGREPVDEVTGDVAFEGVWFEYEPGVPVLKNVTFTARAGTTTALVGSSGSGKSTLLGLVMAFHRPSRGIVRIDGRDLATLRLREYRRHLGVVLQDNFLFDGTVADNIRQGSPQATREDIERAGRVACVDEFVATFEHGYDTIVGERGVRLSGGQRQRVAIARAILADPRVLLLDEATSSLDSESEARIQDSLRSLRHGRTTLVIAHRLSTIRNADRILVLEGGEIVESGTHAELLALGGRYRALYDRQHHAESDRFANPGEERGRDVELLARESGRSSRSA